MIRRPEELPQKAIFKAGPRSKWADGMNSDYPRLDTPSSGQRAMERTSSTGPNLKLVVAPDKYVVPEKQGSYNFLGHIFKNMGSINRSSVRHPSFSYFCAISTPRKLKIKNEYKLKTNPRSGI
jgi:hypothetical protein